jgi:hypothetical protein
MKERLYSVLTALAAAALFGVGCEKGTGTQGLIIEPAVVEFASEQVEQDTTNGTVTVQVDGDDTVVFTVTSNSLRQLSFPLQWAVSRPDLGTITSASGPSAVYVRGRNRVGVNVVSAKDQYGEEGFATVYQE